MQEAEEQPEGKSDVNQLSLERCAVGRTPVRSCVYIYVCVLCQSCRTCLSCDPEPKAFYLFCAASIIHLLL